MNAVVEPPQNAPDLDANELVEIRVRDDFFQDAKGYLITIFCLSVVLSSLLAWYVYLLLNKVPEPKYFQMTAANQLVKPQPLDKPHLPENVVLYWITEVVSRGYSFNYSNMERIILSLEPNFTKRGFNSFLDALVKTGKQKWVARDKLISSASATEAPIVTREGVVDGRYAWSIRLPMRVIYSGVNMRRQQNILVRLLVIRDATNEDSPWGMKIFNLKTQTVGRMLGG